MNNQIKLAVAAALLAAASSANAGIVIPAGDWTLDISGVVNAYYTSTKVSGSAVGSGIALGNNGTTSNITTGLLPNVLSFSGKTRQNDLDVAFTIAMNPGSSTTGALQQGAKQENRQAFMTIGDASWGSVKLGKDLGIFASDAILNDMTLLGVGAGAGGLAGNTTTLGRIGSGYIYADWKSQIAYTSPNWNGFSFTAGVTQGWNAQDAFANGTSAVSARRGGDEPAFEGKASYAWAGDVSGKVWVSGFTQNVNSFTGLPAVKPARANAMDIGANVNLAGFGLTGYYYTSEGVGTTGVLDSGYALNGGRRDSDGGYVQATYTIPNVATKLGVSWGISKLDLASGEAASSLVKENEMWTVGAYHPLTKHVNLVAEYSDVTAKAHNNLEGKAKTASVGAILFF
jgi:predicted porin